MEVQAGSQMPVTDNSTSMKFQLIIDLALSNISITLILGHQFEGTQIDMGSNLYIYISKNGLHAPLAY